MNYALIGAPGSGKSSVADALGVRMSFADGVRSEAADMLAPIVGSLLHDLEEAGPNATLLGVPSVSLYIEMSRQALLRGMVLPEKKDTFRPFLQVWGTDFRRAQDPDYWVNALSQRIVRSMAEDSSRTLVVDDCRFPNEYDMLGRRGFKFIRLMSGPFTRPLTGAQLAHESEQHWPSFPVDLTLDFQEGASVQAQRILEFFDEKG